MASESSFGLNGQQLDEYRRNGLVVVPELFSSLEIISVLRELEKLCKNLSKTIIYEEDGRTPRSIFNLHADSDVFRCLVRHPKIVSPAKDILQEPFYAFQLQINFKQAFVGGGWPWHQDYPVFHVSDGMPDCKALNVLVFLEDVNEFNGPLYFVPRSQHLAFPLPELESERKRVAGSFLSTIEDATRHFGLVSPKGPAGSVIFAHPNIIHGSPSNISPFGRALMTLTFNALSNRASGSGRPHDVVPNDYTEIVQEAAECLERSLPQVASRSRVFNRDCFRRDSVQPW